MNVLVLLATLGTWPTLPEPATGWPALPPIKSEIVVSVSEEGRWSASRAPASVDAKWPDLGDHEPSSVEEELVKPVPTDVPAESDVWKTGPDGKIVRLPGPRVPWPHQGCLMCLGIHLERTHRIPMDHLQSFGRDQWDAIHCNFHNKLTTQSAVNAKTATPPATAPPPKTEPMVVPKAETKSGSCPGGNCPTPSTARWRGMFR